MRPTEARRRELDPNLIERPRLLEQLDGTQARVIALIAPAGFGKTTLARQWISRREIGDAWYSVGSEGFDVAAVAARIAAVVSTVVSGAGERMLTRLSVSTDPEAEAVLLAELLSKEIAAWPADTRLVIDDYQALSVSRACERFIGTLVRETPLRLLVTSRRRPSWASSRLRLYGDLLEIGRVELEMTPSEASEVLAPIADEAQRAQLAKLCHGWPAVLGLAARTGGAPLPRDPLPPVLFDYFAEELFHSAAPDLQRLLCQISAAPCLTGSLLGRIGGDSALELAASAEQSGFFQSAGVKELSLHPLLRDFLRHQLDQRPDRAALIDELAAALLESDRWDDVWQLAQDSDRPDLIPRLIERSLPTLLDGSRLPALSSWAEFGRANNVASPILDLAEAEIAFLAGEHSRAYALALQATHQFDDASPLAWRAHAIAARTAHFSDRLETGIVHAQKARALAPDRHAIQHCLWTEFLCAYELENERDCTSILAELEASQDGHPDTTARVFQGSLLLSNLIDYKTTEAAQFEHISPLLDRVHPQIRASVIASHCDYLSQLARYSEAEAGLARVWDVLAEFDLLFAIPGVYCVRAINAIGLRRYRQAEFLLDAAGRAVARSAGSVSIQTRILLDVLSLLKGDFATDTVGIGYGKGVAKCWRGLGLSVEALKRAVRGDPKAALEYASRADDMTRSTEARSLTLFTRAIAAAYSDSIEAIERLAEAIEFADERQRWNQFVWAYRAYPKVLNLIASEPKLTVTTQPILLSARDDRLAARHGIDLTGVRNPRLTSDDGLTRREREVLRLVAGGLSNKDVATELFISEFTVKLHLRHIYGKLGVRNRVEAALRTVYSDET